MIRTLRRDIAQLAFVITLLIALAIQTASYMPVLLMAGPFFMDAGKAICSNLVSGLGGTVPKYCAMGTGAGPADSTAAALTTEVETRATGTVSRVTTTVTNDTHQVVGTVTATTARVITECGLFDATSAGNMLIGSGIAAINLANGDSIQFTYKLKFA